MSRLDDITGSLFSNYPDEDAAEMRAGLNGEIKDLIFELWNEAYHEAPTSLENINLFQKKVNEL